MRHSLVDEALANIVMNGHVDRRTLRQCGLLGTAVAAVGKQIPGIPRRHQTCAGQRQCDAASVDGDPAAAPLLRYERGAARAACGVKHEIAGIRGHQYTTLDYIGSSL